MMQALDALPLPAPLPMAAMGGVGRWWPRVVVNVWLFQPCRWYLTLICAQPCVLSSVAVGCWTARRARTESPMISPSHISRFAPPAVGERGARRAARGSRAGRTLRRECEREIDLIALDRAAERAQPLVAIVQLLAVSLDSCI